MNTISMAGIGGLITALFAVLRLFGVEVPEGSDAAFAQAVGTLVGIGLLVWGQLRRKDLQYGLIHK